MFCCVNFFFFGKKKEVCTVESCESYQMYAIFFDYLLFNLNLTLFIPFHLQHISSSRGLVWMMSLHGKVNFILGKKIKEKKMKIEIILMWLIYIIRFHYRHGWMRKGVSERDSAREIDRKCVFNWICPQKFSTSLVFVPLFYEKVI